MNKWRYASSRMHEANQEEQEIEEQIQGIKAQIIDKLGNAGTEEALKMALKAVKRNIDQLIILIELRN